MAEPFPDAEVTDVAVPTPDALEMQSDEALEPGRPKGESGCSMLALHGYSATDALGLILELAFLAGMLYRLHLGRRTPKRRAPCVLE